MYIFIIIRGKKKVLACLAKYTRQEYPLHSLGSTPGSLPLTVGCMWLISVNPVSESFFPKAATHPTALEAFRWTFESSLKNLLSSTLLGPIDGLMKGITNARELYLQNHYSDTYTLTNSKLYLQNHYSDTYTLTYLWMFPAPKLQHSIGMDFGFLIPTFILPHCFPLHSWMSISPRVSNDLGSSSKNGIDDLQHRSMMSASVVLFVFTICPVSSWPNREREHLAADDFPDSNYNTNYIHHQFCTCFRVSH